MTSHWTKTDTYVVLGLVVIAAIFRLWRLDDVPPGFQFDEAYNASDALRVLAGEHPLFFEANGGREARAAERRGPEEPAAERVEGVVPRVAARPAPRAQPLVDRLEQSGVRSPESGVKATCLDSRLQTPDSRLLTCLHL